MPSSMINGQISNLSQFLQPTQNPNKVALDRDWLTWEHDRIEKTNNFSKSGIISQSEPLEQQLLRSGNGYMISVPHVTSLNVNEAPQKLDNRNDIISSPAGSAFPEQEVKLLVAKSYANNDIDDYLTGTNNFDNISAQMADYWAHQDEKLLIKVINDTFLNKIIAAAKGFHLQKNQQRDFSATDFAKSLARMGDNNQNALTKIAVNSAVYRYMIAQQLIPYQQPNGQLSNFQNYEGLAVVPDDDIPLSADGHTCAYIFGGGAVDMATATLPNGLTTTVDPQAQGGIRALTQKRAIVAHVAGTDADLATAGSAGYSERNWADAINDGNVAIYKPVNYQQLRDIKIVKYGFTVDKDFVVPGVNSMALSGNNNNGISNNKSNNTRKSSK